MRFTNHLPICLTELIIWSLTFKHPFHHRHFVHRRVRCLPVNHLWSTHTSLQKESLNRPELASGVSRLHTESLEFSGGTFTETVLFDINCWLVRYFLQALCHGFVLETPNDQFLTKNKQTPSKWKHGAALQTYSQCSVHSPKILQSLGCKNSHWTTVDAPVVCS